VAQFLSNFREFPPRQKPASFSVADVIEQMGQGASGGA
jgi:arylsulfatase